MNKNNDKKINQRVNSTNKYIDDLFSNYSRLNFIKPDLGYKKEISKNLTLEEANKDFKRMLNNTRSKPTVFDNLVGYIAKREYTEEKGVHFHPIFIYDANKVQKDVHKAEQIANYWKNDITKGNGISHNCNRNNYKHKALGIIEHNDVKKIELLKEKVIPYICKEEQSIDGLKKSNKDRSLTRGIAPKSKSKVGRPRGTNTTKKQSK